MGSVVGEKITRAAEECLERRVPLIIISCSGGARMQESVNSLMQMAKISAALGKLHEEGIPFISIMTDPTTGGVTASFAMLGDINIAEPKALIGFAGPRVIEQTILQKLPEGFQRSEFLLEKGMLDLVVNRGEMRETLIRLLKIAAVLEAEVVAEGIEDTDDYHLLQEMGVKMGQGYLFGKPKLVRLPRAARANGHSPGVSLGDPPAITEAEA